jgi:outer membrane protein OmpA-like peptidoglycan-associated protein
MTRTNIISIIATAVGAVVLTGCGANANTCSSMNTWGTPSYRCATAAPPVVAEPEVEPDPEPPAPEPVVAKKAELKKDTIEIMEKVQFATGKATLIGNSTDILDEVATIMTDNPDLTRVRIEGHTDSRGGKTMNRKLSKKRAEAVRAYLIKRGVNKSRLEAEGFGPDQPISDNDSDTGREQNRRVEFRIIARAE